MLWWSWHSFEDLISAQSAGARGRSGALCATGEREREKGRSATGSRERERVKQGRSGVRTELRKTGILHADCLLSNGLPKEYAIQSDCTVHR